MVYDLESSRSNPSGQPQQSTQSRKRVRLDMSPKSGQLSPLIAAHRIPSITTLLEQLACVDQARSVELTDDIRIFLRKNKPKHISGEEQWDWKAQQSALETTITDFLDQEQHGEKYWPSNPIAANFNALQYSTDRTL